MIKYWTRIYYNLPFLISSTISGFNNVEISPKLEKSPSAIFLKMRRIIFPERVFGNPETNWILSNLAIGPTWSEINWLISLDKLSLSLLSPVSFKITKPYNAFPLISWGKPTIALSATAGCSLIESSIGAVPKLCPETIITSSTRPVIR